MAHPRSRGENRGRCRGLRRLRGLIPAHAGKTPRHTPRRRGPWAHPRSRGENHALVHAWPVRGGSSPLTRGKPARRQRQRRRCRLIPAHAGKTNPLASRVRSSAAHPRSRGENQPRAHQSHRGSGSSPLTRGKRPEASNEDYETGLIPAHAGKTVVMRVSHFRRWAHPRSRGEN